MSKKLKILIIVIAVVVFCVSAYKLIWSYYQEHTANKAYDDIRQAAGVEKPDGNKTAGDEDTFPTLAVDFDALYNINPEINAWLYIPDTPVSYPILHGTDNHTYLSATYDKKPNVLGSIFQDYRNDTNFEDINTIIYGHNTRNDAMFGCLKRFKEQAYADEHKYIHIIRKNAVYVYEIFAAYETPATSNTYTIWFQSRETYTDYLNEMASQTIIQAASIPDYTERIITLSTCTGGQKIMRFVLQAKFVASYAPASI